MPEIHTPQQPTIEACFATIFSIAEQSNGQLPAEYLVIDDAASVSETTISFPKDVIDDVYASSSSYTKRSLSVIRTNYPNGLPNQYRLLAAFKMPGNMISSSYEDTIWRPTHGLLKVPPETASPQPATERYAQNFTERISRLAEVCLLGYGFECQISKLEARDLSPTEA